MTEQEARDRLERMVAHDDEPPLSTDEIDDLLALARRADSLGAAPSDDGWSPTYDLNYAAAEGWRWKAGKVAGRYSAQVDGATFQRQQLFAHCLRMAEQYALRLVGSAPIGQASGEDLDDLEEVIGNG